MAGMHKVTVAVFGDLRRGVDAFRIAAGVCHAEAVRQLLQLGLDAYAAQTAVPPTPNSLMSQQP